MIMMWYAAALFGECRRYGNGKYTGLNYSFFFPGFMVDIQPTPIVYKEVLLLHKVEGYNDHGVRFELGERVDGRKGMIYCAML